MSAGISESRVFYLLGLALNVLFRVFDRHGDMRAIEPQSTHPLPDLRFFHAMFVGLGYLQHHEPDKARSFEKQAVAAARDVESVWSEARIDAPSFERWRYKPTAHLDELIQELEQLRADHLYAFRDQRIEDLRRRTAV